MAAYFKLLFFLGDQPAEDNNDHVSIQVLGEDESADNTTTFDEIENIVEQMLNPRGDGEYKYSC